MIRSHRSKIVLINVKKSSYCITIDEEKFYQRCKTFYNRSDVYGYHISIHIDDYFLMEKLVHDPLFVQILLDEARKLDVKELW